MTTTAQIAKHFREVHFGGNWTAVNLKDSLAGIGWEQATRRIHDCNSIAVLVFHMNYYVSAVLKFLQGEKMNAHDKYSFDCPPVQSEADWQQLVTKTMEEAEAFAQTVESLPDEILGQTFVDEKYGNYYRNLHGIIEHCHYHLGQVVILKKIISG